MFDVFYFGKKPNLFQFEKYASTIEEAAEKSRTEYFWYLDGQNDYTDFDFEFTPPPWQKQFVHTFASQWQCDGGTYIAHKDFAKNKNLHFIDTIVSSTTNNIFFIDKNNPTSTARFYRLREKYPDIQKVRYANSILDTIKRCITKAKTNKFWVISSEYNYDNFDFTWHPSLWQSYMTHVFPSQHQKWSDTFLINKREFEIHSEWATSIDQFPNLNFVIDQQVLKQDNLLDIYYVDHGNPESSQQIKDMREKYPDIQKVRYANSILDTIKRCITKAKTNKFWVISSEYNYDNFDFTWHPEPWQNEMIHVFPSQHQKWSDTFLINKREFEIHSEWATSIDQFPNLNFVIDQQVLKQDNLLDIYYVDHGNPESSQQIKDMREKYPDLVVTRFMDNYLDTFKRIMTTANTEHVWIVNSICDYSNFDFTWQPEPWQNEMIHVFQSGAIKEGDTFYIHVKSFKEQMIDLELLDWFNVINYCTHTSVRQWPTPVIRYDSDDLVTVIKEYNFTHPYALFTKHNEKSIDKWVGTGCLWSKKDRSVKKLTTDGSTVLVPRDIKAVLRTQIYDYPYLFNEKSHYIRPEMLDIVYISNGEPEEERWYDHTCTIANGRDVKWVRNVNGRKAAYQAAASVSSTPWFFAVFAKLEIDANFDWDWVPDYFQEPKHYIFNALNPLNGLEYGHQGLIAYNKKLTITNDNPGIDFTLSQPHESVPIMSGTAHFNVDPWTTWRTAFREVIKLKMFTDASPTVETTNRLNTWLNVANGKNAEWCLKGAGDAINFYEKVNGNSIELQKSFEWDWLRSQFNIVVDRS